MWLHHRCLDCLAGCHDGSAWAVTRCTGWNNKWHSCCCTIRNRLWGSLVLNRMLQMS